MTAAQKTCSHCAGLFTSKHRDAVYCGRKCSYAAWRLRNLESVQEKERARALANPEAARARYKRWRQSNASLADARSRGCLARRRIISQQIATLSATAEILALFQSQPEERTVQ